jgi:hypothetical protein
MQIWTFNPNGDLVAIAKGDIAAGGVLRGSYGKSHGALRFLANYGYLAGTYTANDEVGHPGLGEIMLPADTLPVEVQAGPDFAMSYSAGGCAGADKPMIRLPAPVLSHGAAAFPGQFGHWAGTGTNLNETSCLLVGSGHSCIHDTKRTQQLLCASIHSHLAKYAKKGKGGGNGIAEGFRKLRDMERTALVVWARLLAAALQDDSACGSLTED